jgi:CRP/FNR family transcriptional regulator, anaerobic regulatory protein
MNSNLLTQCQACPTRQLCLAAGLDRPALERLATRTKPSAPLEKGASLFRAGDNASGCFVVRSGAFKTFVISPGGDEYVTGFYFPGELLGMAGQASGTHRESASALMTSTACRVQLEDIPTLWEIGSGPSLLRLMGQAEHLSSEGRINLSQSRADARVAGFLLALSERMRRQGRDPYRVPIPMSRTDLACFLGMTLECLSRVLSRLSRAGSISATRNEITLRATQDLAALAGHAGQAGHAGLVDA